MERVIRKIDEPIPPAYSPGKPRDPLFAAMVGMVVGDCLEVERSMSAVATYVWRFRKAGHAEWKFRIRATEKIGWSKIWRLE